MKLLCAINFTTFALFVIIAIAILPVSGKKSPKLDLRLQECLKTSRYVRDDQKFACKDLGLCYQHYCKSSARTCGKCSAAGSNPCALRTHDFNRTTPHFLGSQNMTQDDHGTGPLRTPTPHLLEVTAGASTCTGFLAIVPFKSKYRLVIVTSAKCLIHFDVTCDSKRGTPSERFNDASSCFGRKSARVTSVVKGFRSYHVTLKNKGHVIEAPLNEKSVLVPAEFMKCGGCRYDVAVIRISSEQQEDLGLDPQGAYLLTSSEEEAVIDDDAIIDTYVEARNRSKLFSNTSESIKRSEVIIISAEKQRLCLKKRSSHRDIISDVAGSPIMLVKKMPDDELGNETMIPLRAIGVATHATIDEGRNEKNQTSDPDRALSAVRFTNSFLKSLTGWLRLDWTGSCNKERRSLHARLDCFPSLLQRMRNASLCLCALGWASERDSCKEPNMVFDDVCEWQSDDAILRCNGLNRTHKHKGRAKRPDPKLVVPGGARQLWMVSMEITNGPRLHEILRHLPSLQVLVLDHNNVKAISGKTLATCSKLKVLSLRHNKLSRLHSDSLRKAVSLEKLVVANNQIKHITRRLFRNMKELQTLHLQRNMIGTLAQNCFRKVVNLREIKLSHNRLDSVARNLFKNNDKLRKVWLDHNLLKTIPATLFSNCHHLSYVNLEGNSLSSIPRGFFRSNVELVTVNFDKNAIETLPFNLFDQQRKLQKVTLHRNPSLPEQLTLPAFVTSASINKLHQLLDQIGSH